MKKNHVSVHFLITETQPTTGTKNKNESHTCTIVETGKTLKIAVKTAALYTGVDCIVLYWPLLGSLKVPKCEIFHLFDFNDFYGIKSL